MAEDTKDSQPKGMYHYLMWGVEVVTVLIILIGAAFPFGNVGSFSADSVYKIAIIYIKNSMLTTSSQMMNCIYLLILAALVQLCVFAVLRNHNSIVISIISGVAVLLTYIPLTVEVKQVAGFYGFTSNSLFPISVIVLVIDLIAIVAGLIYWLRKNRRAVVQESCQADNDLPAPAKKKVAFGKIFELVSSLACACLILVASIVINPFNRMLGKFNGTLHPDIIAYELGDSFFGLDVEEVDMENFKIGTEVYNYKSTNYEFWSERLAELNAELQIYSKETTKLSEIKQKISKLNEIFENLQYENIRITTNQYIDKYIAWGGATVTEYRGDIVEILYDTKYTSHEENSVKWNVTTDKKLLCNQSITLTCTEFKENTDFAKAKIGATVLYNDGSVKKSYITPLNCEELSSASAGKHVLKWADSWGEYEYEISIV